MNELGKQKDSVLFLRVANWGNEIQHGKTFFWSARHSTDDDGSRVTKWAICGVAWALIGGWEDQQNEEILHVLEMVLIDRKLWE